MDDIYILSDTELTSRISAKLKELRLGQNISRQDLSYSSGVSMSSIVRMEDGEIKSFESLLRVLRTLGKLDVFAPLIREEDISPSEYFKMEHFAKINRRKRASRSKRTIHKEESEW